MPGTVISALKNIYDRSGIPVVFTDSRYCVIWKNKLAVPLFGEGECLTDIFEGAEFKEGVVNAYQADMLCSFNVVRLDGSGENDPAYIVEFLHSDSMIKILNIPEIRDYVNFVCSKIKEAAGVVINSADEIFDAVSCGLYDGQMITDRLNIIDENIMSLTKEIVMPDQFYSLMDMDGKNKATLAMDRELQRFVGKVESNIGKFVKVTSKCDRGIFFRMDKKTFETLVSGMTERCCCGKIFPEMLVYSVSRTGDSRAELSVTSISPENRRNDVRLQTIRNAELRDIKKDIFFDYICELLCSDSGAAFTKTEMPNGYNFKMEFDIISAKIPVIAMEITDYDIDKGIFDTVPLMLADFPVQKRYKYYDIDAEETDDSAKENAEAKDEIS